jgi:arsenate reductase-like glutaredoxin family protein
MQKPGPLGIEGAAQKGTGPGAMAAAVADAVLGGFGITSLFGVDAIFKDETDARQTLRAFRERAKEILLRGTRKTRWSEEQLNKILPDPEKLIRNSSTEARKIGALRKQLQTELYFNTQAITNGSEDTINEMNRVNVEIKGILSQMDTGKTQSVSPVSGRTYEQVMKELIKADADGDSEKAEKLANEAKALRKPRQ